VNLGQLRAASTRSQTAVIFCWLPGSRKLHPVHTERSIDYHQPRGNLQAGVPSPVWSRIRNEILGSTLRP